MKLFFIFWKHIQLFFALILRLHALDNQLRVTNLDSPTALLGAAHPTRLCLSRFLQSYIFTMFYLVCFHFFQNYKFQFFPYFSKIIFEFLMILVPPPPTNTKSRLPTPYLLLTTARENNSHSLPNSQSFLYQFFQKMQKIVLFLE